jgi:methylamine dehydrogenase light chain
MSARRRLLHGSLLCALTALVAIAALQLVPTARADVEAAAGDPGDPQYWRYCSIDGFLSSACGGSATACPPGTEMAAMTWLGTCRNPEDGKDYVISYNDCCGKTFCGQGFVNRNEDDMPVYFAPKSNDINWCMGSASRVYNSTVAIVVGVASE